jgi:hypothetical protein
MKKLLIVSPWLADFGHGLIITIILLTAFGVEPTAMYMVLGLLFSVLPDLDGVKEFFHYGKIDTSEHGDHRDGLHYPIIWLMAGAVFIFVNTFLGTLFTLCVLAHFLNDSWGTGWGVKWLWPLNKRSYKFSSVQFVTSWDDQGKKSVAEHNAHPNWLEDIYGRVTTVSVIEYGTFIVAVILTILYLTE